VNCRCANFAGLRAGRIRRFSSKSSVRCDASPVSVYSALVDAASPKDPVRKGTGSQQRGTIRTNQAYLKVL
jgi:hypothetical protein